MKAISRRHLLLLGAGAAAAAGCGRIATRIQGDDLPESIELPSHDVHPTARLLNRAGFGPKPGQIAAVEKMGLERYLDEQLAPTDEEPLALRIQLDNLEALSIDSEELRDESEDEVLTQIQAAALLRPTYSPWQLRERMVDFWTNHFNIYAHKGLSVYRKPTDEEDVIRKNALGRFPNLLTASAHSPAMLAYLDNNVNKAGVANENYARELMELHTLGLHGGYTQRDVQEVARCFTGWTVEDRFGHRTGAFRFDPDAHDDGVKRVLGQLIPAGGGENDAMLVLDMLGKHPSTARFVSAKMCRHFLGGADSPWVDKLAKIYLESSGDIGLMLKPMLLSPEFRDGPPIAKRPLDYVVSSLRAFDAETDCGPTIQKHLADMGQGLYEWPMPDGYPDRTNAWTGSLLARWNFASALTSGAIQGTAIDYERLRKKMSDFDVRHLALDTSPNVPRLASRFKDVTAKSATLALCAPEFQWR
jgi:uncharacterized protein (DUF1800 family)